MHVSCQPVSSRGPAQCFLAATLALPVRQMHVSSLLLLVWGGGGKRSPLLLPAAELPGAADGIFPVLPMAVAGILVISTDSPSELDTSCGPAGACAGDPRNEL